MKFTIEIDPEEVSPQSVKAFQKVCEDRAQGYEELTEALTQFLRDVLTAKTAGSGGYSDDRPYKPSGRWPTRGVAPQEPTEQQYARWYEWFTGSKYPAFHKVSGSGDSRTTRDEVKDAYTEWFVGKTIDRSKIHIWGTPSASGRQI